tara:strand:+ start:124 stop:534 length:411 start_codon:yes stop_codon:yes gene_type:complete
MAVRKIHSNSIPDNAITTDHIGTGVIVSDDIAANAVTTTDIQDDAVTSAKVATNAIGIDALNLSDGTSGQALITNGSGTISFGSVGAQSDIFYTNAQTLSTNYSLGANRSAMSAGPVTLGSGVTVTLGSNSRWVVV